MAKPALAFPNQHQIALGRHGKPNGLFGLFQHANPANGRRRQNRATFGFIVERHIARDDREIQRDTRRRHPPHGGSKLPHDFRLFRIAEIHVVRDCQRQSANGGDIAPGFRNRLLAAFLGIRQAITRRTIRGHGKCPVMIFNPDHRRIRATRALHRLAIH